MKRINEYFLAVLMVAFVVAFVFVSHRTLPPTLDGMGVAQGLQDALLLPLALLGVFMVFASGVLFFAGGCSFRILDSWKDRFPTAAAIVVAAIIVGGALVLKVR